MRTLFTSLALVAGLSACGSDAATYDLTVSGEGYDPHNGQLLEIALVDSSGAVVDSQSTTVADGTFTFTWTGVLEEGETYEVHHYADLNESAACDAPPDDHGWSDAISAVADNVDITRTHATDFTDVCGTFVD